MTKYTLYKAMYADFPNNWEWNFNPTSFNELVPVLNLLANEHDTEEQDREFRVMALLNGEVVCTNLAAYKLVKEDS